MIYDHVGATRDPFKQDLAPKFCKIQKKSSVFSLKLISTMIKHTMHGIIDWAPSFSLLEIATQKECFFCFFWVLKVSLRLTLIQKGGLCRLRLLPLMIVLFVPLKGIAPENSWLGGTFWRIQNYMQNENERNEKKKINWSLKLYYG